ncbi:unnamed protein product [Owenia fusiformis]|uniref:Uncharacterized protein n=1 Tax=Owenia fusiformis TaxID=6347 RepID=A0A8J1UX43_OWEFU|nr:unnamed protein product [Owenia fusiformis]
MAEVTRLVYSMVKFLVQQRDSGALSDDGIESLEVAIECLQTAYGVSMDDTALAARYGKDPPLPEIFNNGIGQTQGSDTTTFNPPPQASEEDKKEADKFKAQGNEFMKNERFEEALASYSKAVEKDGNNAVYYCNRAAAYAKLNDQESALADCESAIAIDPTYSKAYGRKGLALTALGEHHLATDSYRKALELDPMNQSYKTNLDIAEQQLKDTNLGGGERLNPVFGNLAPGGMGGMDIGAMLGNPAIMNMATQMMSNPEMQQMLGNMMGAAGGGGGNMDSLFSAGQQLAQQMQASNPELVEQLRQRVPGGEEQPNEPKNPDQQNPDAGQS